MPISDESRKRYIEHPFLCPFCLSKDISTTSDIDSDGSNAWQSIKCRTCGKKWNDIYKLTDVEEQVEEQ